MYFHNKIDWNVIYSRVIILMLCLYSCSFNNLCVETIFLVSSFANKQNVQSLIVFTYQNILDVRHELLFRIKDEIDIYDIHPYDRHIW